MSAQSFLAKAGLRTATMGSAGSLAIALPLTEGSYDPAAHTAATRTGIFGVTGTSLSVVTNGTTILTASVTSLTSTVIGVFPASTTAAASIRLPTGVAPTSPTDGDVWVTTAAMFVRVNGSTQQIAVSGGTIGGSIANTQVAVGSGANTLSGSAALTYASGILTASANAATIVPVSGTRLDVIGSDGTDTRAVVSAFGAGVVPSFSGRHARNTGVAPAAVQSGDVLVNLAGWGFGSTVFSTAARIIVSAIATETWTDLAQGTAFRIIATPNGTTATAEALRVFGDGGVQIGGTFSASPGIFKLLTAATTATNAGLNLPHGTAPTTPVNGDLWTTTAALFVRINGVTQQLGTGTGTIGGSIAANQVAYGSGANAIQGSAALTFSGTDLSTTGHIFTADGTAGAPALSFTSDPTLGAYRVSAGTLGVAVGGVLTASISATAFTSTVIGVFPASTTGAASIRLPHGVAPTSPVNGDLWTTTTAVFARINGATQQLGTGTIGGSITTNQVAWGSGTNTIQGTAALTFNGTDLSTTGHMFAGNGTAAAPAFSFTSDTGLGVYRVGAGDLGFAVGGALVADVSATALTSTVIGVFPASTTAAASIRLPHGAAPTSPVNGDAWTVPAGFFSRINGATYNLIGSLVTTVWPATNASGVLTNDGAGNLSWAASGGTIGGTAANTRVAFGSGVNTITSVSAFTYNSTVLLLQNVATATSGGSTWQSTFFRTTWASSGSSATPLIGIEAQADTTGSGTNTGTIVGAQISTFNNNSSGTLTSLKGINLNVNTASGSTTTTLYGIYSSTTVAAGHTATTAYGLYVFTNYAGTVGTKYGVYQDDATALNYFTGVTGVGVAPSASTFLNLGVSTTGLSSLRMGHGVAPTSPVNGDLWTTTAGVFAQINGSTIQFAATGIYLPLAGGTMTGKLVTVASAAVAGAGFNMPVGASPTSPVTGDMWLVDDGLGHLGFAYRFAGSTRYVANFTALIAPLANQVMYSAGGTSGAIQGDAGFTWDTTTLAITGNIGLNIAGTTATEINIGASTTGRSCIRMAGGGSPTSPVDGDIWNNNSQKGLAAFVAGMTQQLSGVVFTQTATATVANTTTETSLISTGIGTTTLPTNFFVAGKTIRIVVRGIISSTLTPTVTINVKLGSTVLCTTGAVALVGAVANNEFTATATITCRTAGVSGTFMAVGQAHFDNATSNGPLEGMANSGTITVNTTTTQVVDTTVTWGTASALNTISGQITTIEVLG